MRFLRTGWSWKASWGMQRRSCAKEEKAVLKGRAVELWSFAMTERLLGYGTLGADHETLMEKWDQ